MTRIRAMSVDQRSFGALSTAKTPGELRRLLLASPETDRMLAFIVFQRSIRGMSVKTGAVQSPRNR
jgi:hypothetical protein